MRNYTYSCLVLLVSFISACGDNGGVTDQSELDGKNVDSLVISEPAAVSYRAKFVAGGYDRIFIYKADKALDVCAILVLKSPETRPSNPSMNIQLPQRWQVERAEELPGANSCNSSFLPIGKSVFASAGSGRVTWNTTGGARLWCGAGGIDVDVSLSFEANAAGLPRTTTLSTTVTPSGC